MNIKPSLQLAFAATQRLDPRITFTNASANRVYFDAAGLLKFAVANEPRFDHDPITGESLGLLIEEARTNLLLNSTVDGAPLVTQNITTTAATRTLSFYGTGQIVLTGTHSATVTGLGSFPTRTTYTYTPTVGTLTLTVTGTVSYANDELGSFATSYIPTAGTSVTRSADVCSITGTNFSSWYNQTEGTFVVSSLATTSSGTVCSANNDGTVERITFGMGVGAGGNISVTMTAGGVSQAQPIQPLNTLLWHTSSFGYKLNDVALSVDGLVVVTDTSATIPTPDRLTIGMGGSSATPLNGHIERITYFPRRLDNSTLQGLTT